MRASPSNRPAAERAFRALLRLYPAAFRDEYGREMTLVFADRYRDDARRWARLGLWMAAVKGVLIGATREHVLAAASDCCIGWRRLRRSPTFTMCAVVTLAMAIAANTLLFSVLNAVVLAPLPYPSPNALTMIWTNMPGRTGGRSSYGNVAEWKRASTLADLAVFDPGTAIVLQNGMAQRLSVAHVSSSFFSVLGVTPAEGRVFDADEAARGVPVAVVSARFRERVLGTGPLTASTMLDIDGHRSQVIGVLPATFRFADADVWEPDTRSSAWDGGLPPRGAGPWFVIALLAPHVTIAAAQTEIRTIARSIDQTLPVAERGRRIDVTPLRDHVAGADLRATLWMLNAAGLAVLMAAIANVGSLSAARGAGRAHEVRLRTALGAGRAVLLRHLAAEGIVVSAIAGALGCLLAAVGLPAVRAAQASFGSDLPGAAVDLRVLVWTGVLASLTAVLVGLAPAISVGHGSSGRDLLHTNRSVSSSRAIRRLRRALVVAQFAITMVLLVGAGLLVRSWLRVTQVDPGFRADRVLSLQLSTPTSWAPSQRLSFYDAALRQVRALPDVVAAGTIGDLFAGTTDTTVRTVDDNHPVIKLMSIRRDEVSAGFFDAVRARVIEGRSIGEQDGAGSPRVAVINRRLADQVWPAGSPIGRRFVLGQDPTPFTVVGVVADMLRQGPEGGPAAQMFEALTQNPSRLETLLVRTRREPFLVADDVEHVIRLIDPRVPVYGRTTLDNRLASYLDRRLANTSLLFGFAVVALIMAAVGTYGLVQQSVTARQREISIRMAVGARKADILRLVIGEGLRLSLIGLSLGALAALILARAASTLLFGIGAADPPTFLAVALILTGVAGAACYIPARRAANTAPGAALQCD
jgi:putative ABC transport system permease protein